MECYTTNNPLKLCAKVERSKIEFSQTIQFISTSSNQYYIGQTKVIRATIEQIRTNYALRVLFYLYNWSRGLMIHVHYE